MASPNLSELVTTTLRDRSGKLADNMSKGNALLSFMTKKGNRKPANGRSIVQELEYAEGNFQWYSGYETLNVTPADVMTAAEFDWKQAASTVSWNGLETKVQNTGKEAIINLLESRIKNAEKTMKNNVTKAMYADGTGSGGKEMGGLQLLIADNPTTGTVGGINRATYTFWRNQYYSSVTDGGGAATATNIQGYMNKIFLRCVRGDDKPDQIIADSAYYQLYWSSLQAIQRITSTEMASAGFTALSYANNIPVIYEDSTGIPANHMYFINSDYLHFRYAPEYYFTPLDSVTSFNQDASTKVIAFAGNLTCSNCSLQGVLKA